MTRLSGGVAVLTGAASGIGRALAREQMTLALAARDERGLHETALLPVGRARWFNRRACGLHR
ncbi:MAG: hypothetical protein NVS4B13_12480 [Candidatus Elarobacter sp.]